MEIKLIGKQGLALIGKKETVLVDPEADVLKKTAARVVVFTNSDRGGLLTENERVMIVGPGEYEVGGVEINGINNGGSGTIYNLLIDGINVCVCGRVVDELSEKKVERIGNSDVMIVNIDQSDTQKSKYLLKLAKSIGVNYLLPIGVDKQDKEMVDFLNVTDNEGLEPVSNIKPDKDNLPEGIEVVLLHE